MTNAFAFDPLAPEFQRDPYAYYGMLRANMPVFYFEPWGMHFLTRHTDVSTLLRDPRLGHELSKHVPPEVAASWPQPPDEQMPLVEMQRNWMLLRDPPDHGRLRSLVHKVFTPRRIDQMRQHIQAITDRLLDRVAAQGDLDLIRDLAFPLPVTVIAEMLGVPAEDQGDFRRWSSAIGLTLELTEDAAVYDAGARATVEISDYFRTLIQARRSDPHDDLLTALIAAEEEGDRLNEDELIATCVLLLFAGHETTVNLIGNGTLALLRHPDQLRRLRDDPALIRSAVEELLRYDSPVQLTSRVLLEDVDFNGQTLPKGQGVFFMLGAANRDPEVFAEADTLDLSRDPNPHVAFGNGIHYCLGAPLARMEGQIAFSTLLRRFPRLALATDSPPYRPTLVLRGLQSLPLLFG